MGAAMVHVLFSRWRAIVALPVAALIGVPVVLAVRAPAEAGPPAQAAEAGPPAPAPAAVAPEAAGSHARHGGAPLTPRTARQVAFHDTMRRLWTDHVLWTRLAIADFAGGSPRFDATAARLLRNQADIGDAVKPYYGRARGARMTALLREHIVIAVELLQAAKAGDAAAVAAIRARWNANANDIADFLAAANPRWWRQAALRAAMRTHLDQTLTEATHELTGDFTAGVADYEEIQAHILAMADLLSSGIIRQFPHRFR